MSVDATDTMGQFAQFLAAYNADYVTRDGKLVIDDPGDQAKAGQGPGQLHGDLSQGLHAAGFGELGRQRQQSGVPRADGRHDTEPVALGPQCAQGDRPEDYYQNTATIEWPLGPNGEPFPIVGLVLPAVVFRDGGNVATAKEFVRFLVGEGWLAH